MKLAREIGIALTLAALIYGAGFALLRGALVKLTHHAGDAAVYRSEALMRSPDGMMGSSVSFYKPAFMVEAKLRGSDKVVINAWAPGMRMWSGLYLFQSG